MFQSAEEIEEHFEFLKRRRMEESLKLEQLNQAQMDIKIEVNTKLRYNEKLQLKRKGATAAFKSMTRAKRNHVPDGLGVVKDEVPDIG